MVLYHTKNPATVDALTLPDGNYVFVKDGKIVSLPKAEFEAQYDKQA